MPKLKTVVLSFVLFATTFNVAIASEPPSLDGNPVMLQIDPISLFLLRLRIEFILGIPLPELDEDDPFMDHNAHDSPINAVFGEGKALPFVDDDILGQ